MVSKFGKTSAGFSNKGEREKFLFIAAAGTALAVVVIFILVAGFKSGGQSPVPVAQPMASALNQQPDSIAYISPETEVPVGTQLSQVKFKTLYGPRNSIPQDVFTDVSQVIGLYARGRLIAGMPVTRKDVTDSDQVPFNTMPLTPGNRAVSIEVDDTSGLEGHALPGTHVDVVLTFNQSGNLVSNIIVQNARVLSYGGDSTAAAATVGQRRSARVARTMTLDVSTQDALKIQTARQMGRLSLIMRAAEDDAAAETTNFTASDLAQANRGPKQPVAAAPCNKGRIKIGGKEYVVACDGTMKAVDAATE
jgi:pilus assembly protein CpaB